MANWNDIKDKICKTTDKVVAKTSEAADIAAKHVKVKAIDGKISDRYEDLGRIYYKSSKNGTEQDEKAKAIITEIDSLIAEKRMLKAEIEADKQKRAEAKKEKKERKEAEKAEAERAKAEKSGTEQEACAENTSEE